MFYICMLEHSKHNLAESVLQFVAEAGVETLGVIQRASDLNVLFSLGCMRSTLIDFIVHFCEHKLV